MAAAANPPLKQKRFSHGAIGSGQRQLFANEEVSEWKRHPERFNQYGRDPQSPAEKERAKTTWHECDPSKWTGKPGDDFTGFTLVPHSFFADKTRLSRSLAQAALLEYGWRMTYGCERKRGEAPPLWSPEISVSHLESIMGCSDRQVNDNIADALSRKSRSGKPAPLIEVKRTTKEGARSGTGNLRYRLLLENWEMALSASETPKEAPVKKEPESAADLHLSDDETDDLPIPEQKPIAVAAGRQILTRNPVIIRRQECMRPVKVTCGVTSLVVKDESPEGMDFEMGFQAEVLAGVLTIATTIQNLRPNGVNGLGPKLGGVPPRNSHGPQAGAPATAAFAATAKNGHPQNGHANGINDFTSKLGGVPPSSPINREALRTMLRKRGYSVVPTLLDRLMAAVPEGCGLEFIGKKLGERETRASRNRPFTAALLPSWFEKDLPEHWIAAAAEAAERAAEAAEQTDRQDDGEAAVQRIRLYLERCAAGLPDGYAKFGRSILKIRDQVTKEADSADLDSSLEEIETLLFASVDGKVRGGVKAAVEAELRPYAKRMTPPQLKDLRRQVERRLVLEAAGLPRLGLFHAR